MRIRSGFLVAALAVSIGGVAAAASTGATVDTPAERVDPPTPALVVGDSAISALRWVPGADRAVAGFEHTLDLESCRRLSATSCTGREDRRPPTVYQALADHGSKYKILVVATGYNDGTSMFEETVVAIIDRARRLGYERIVWWTLRSDVDYVSPGSWGNHRTFDANNRVLRDLLATGEYPDVVLADWDRYTEDRPEWFVTDGVHYRAVGAWGAADYLSRKMAFLDGRRCPAPTAPGRSARQPCPDPDVTGPEADIEALYPVGDDGVLCYELGEERRIECRTDTHVIRIERELASGMSGDDVAALQTRLVRLGWLVDGADGVFGPATRDAVTTFDVSVGLPTDGVADLDTLDALGFDVSGIR